MMGKSNYKLVVFETKKELYLNAAEVLSEIAATSIASRGKFTIALSGGKTPAELYTLLANPFFREKFDWQKVFVFWGDERFVPGNDERNNSGQAISTWLSKINIAQDHIFPVPVNLPPEEAAAEYEKTIKSFWGNEKPAFDLILLGIGENGHTASIFPYSKLIDEQKEGIRAFYLEEEKIFRITMTAPLINCSRNVLFLVTGKNKAEILENVLEGQRDAEKYPAQLIRPADGNLLWFVDKDAAAKLKT